MCNLYSSTPSPDWLRKRFEVSSDRDFTGNLPPSYAIFPDAVAPVVRKDAAGERELRLMRWGFPHAPPKPGEKPRFGYVTNVRNLKSPYWRPSLKNDFRCLVPASAFSEYTDSLPKVCTWFARDEERTPFAFAGIWRPWSGTRGTKASPAVGDHLVFSFLTTEANDIVRPIHDKAMPVILTEEHWDIWLDGDPAEALALQRPAPNDLIRIVAKGEKRDPPESRMETQ
jgi:putative SOS response-associated peptidase YedK